TGKTKLLYVAPESLTKYENVALLKQIKVSFYAVDEAHCISEWGHDFRPEYRRIHPIVSEIGKAPIIALTATATPKVQSDIQKNLGMSDAKVFKSSFNRPNLYYDIRPKVNPDREIIKFIKNNEGKSGIIYCLSRKRVEQTAQLLSVNGIRALPYHAGLDAATRAENHDKFLMEEADVIVATIAFGMGIDKPDVRFVIHYDMPKSLEGYYQETGRSGRDGGEGQCVAFYSYKDIQKLEKFMQGKPIAEQEVGRQLLLETVAYAETNLCRRIVLLNYFGEQYTTENCGSCDNCLYPKKQFDGREEVTVVLDLISGMKEQFKAEHIVNILAGVNNSIIKSYDHHNHELFGIGISKGVKFWMAVIRQCTIHHLLEKEIERYGILSITQKGEEFLEKPYKIMITEDREFLTEDDDEEISLAASKHAGSAGDPVLLSMLKSLRLSISKKINLPPFVIFNDTSLEDMSIHYPIEFDELKHCQGVGEGKAKRYGKDFLELIYKYVEENEIERPSDLIIKSVANKSLNKVYIITSIDRKLPLEDIAESKGMEMEELLTEIEAIVNSGTRLNIDYYIRQTIDDDKVDDIYEYFKTEASTDSLKEAADELGRGYTEEEIRLVRIQFFSEMGN
ncbi:MAG: RecQ family ATP-dependent DNA helicase, partial [Bacteroidales bacterium]